MAKIIPFLILFLVPLAPQAVYADGEALQTAPVHAPEPEMVVVDVARYEGPVTYAGSGFLHGMTFTEPADSHAAPLKPKLFRNAASGRLGAFETYERVRRFGARSQIVISDSYGYKGEFPGDEGAGYGRFEDVITRLVRQAKELNQIHQWDVWNEPESKHFWPRTREQFFETWKRAVRLIRSLDADGESTVVGPSIGIYDAGFLEAFITFARDEHVLPDILSWHEIRDSSAPAVDVHVEDMRQFLKDNKIRIERIQINEYGSKQLQLDPGAAVWYLAQLEYSGVDGAAKACWYDGGKSTCLSATLGGLLSMKTRSPRPIWWAYKGYAHVTGTLLGVEPSGRVNGVAAYDFASGRITVVLGNTGGEGPVEIRFMNMDKILPGAGAVTLQVQAARIPYGEDGRAELASPVESVHARYKVIENELRLPLPDFGGHDAYMLEISTA